MGRLGPRNTAMALEYDVETLNSVLFLCRANLLLGESGLTQP